MMLNIIEDSQNSYLSEADIDLIIQNFKEAKVEMIACQLKDDTSDMTSILEEVPDDEIIKVMLDDNIIEINKPTKRAKKRKNR